jgi:hypothetical protein
MVTSALPDDAMTDPGKPSPTAPRAGDVDEFAHIPTPRTRHPVLAVAAALLSAFLVIHVRHELRYALSPGEPLELGDAKVTFSPRTTVTGLDNRLVRVAGTPDRESGLEVDTKGSWTFSQFFRILGTGDKLFVHRRESPLPGPRAEADVFEGRLVRFRELPFEDAVRRYFSAHVVATHFFAPDDLRNALVAPGREAGGVIDLKDRAGDPVKLASEDLLAIDVLRPDEVRVGLPRERFIDGAAARAEIEKRGGTIVSAKGLVKVEAGPTPGALLSSGPPPTERWTFIAKFSGPGRDAALSALGELDRKVEIRDARETIKAHLADLQATDGGISVSGRALPIATIAAVRTLATVQVPEDAYLLIEGDTPREHLPTLLLALAVASFGAFNLAALARGLRR